MHASAHLCKPAASLRPRGRSFHYCFASLARALQDGSCLPQAEPCIAGTTCCTATSGLYCQRSTTAQLLGTCEEASCVRGARTKELAS